MLLPDCSHHYSTSQDRFNSRYNNPTFRIYCIPTGQALNNVLDSSPTDQYSPAIWRVIIHRGLTGAANMAIDEALAESVGTGQAPPTLRFYDWCPACLSLGYSQSVSDVDFDRVRERGWDVVRRLTGGRAILHTDELTYSLTIPEDNPRVAGDVVESYRRLSRGLMAGLNALGAAVHAQKAGDEAHRFKGPVCFEVPSDYEITVQGRKLIGSAQTRRAGQAILQHGALPLSGDLRRICDGLNFPDESAREAAKARVIERAITLEEALGESIPFERAAEALWQGFSAALNLTFEPADLFPAEADRAEQLRAEKYATRAWTARH
jgi:lipoate-protein ligase A